MLVYNPACALDLVSYQRIITSASQSLPLKAWLRYNANPYLRWDQRLSDLWNETNTSTTNSSTQHPVVVLVLRTTSQTISLTLPFVTAHNALDHLITKNPDLQYAVAITTDTVQQMHAPTSTFACLGNASTHLSPVQIGDQSHSNSEASPDHAHTTYTTTLEQPEF